jgi:hypothetical protein
MNAFKQIRGEEFQGGFVFRQFIELEPIGVHPKSQMPLTQEYRLFVLNKKLIAYSEYWTGENYVNKLQPNSQQFEPLFAKIKSHFFTIDIAKTKNGDWIIIELGDGQVAEYLGDEGLAQFYAALSDYGA